MKYVVVDIERNPIDGAYKAEREICKEETIQIGAVVLDENYNEIGHFMTLVKPQLNEKITRKIRLLTGITTEKVQNAPGFEDALDSFFHWCESIPGKVEIFQWSESDYINLIREMVLKGYDLKPAHLRFFMNWTDFQQEYGDVLGLDQKISLEKALIYAGADFEGKQHDALYDARNTAALLTIVRTPELRKKALQSVIDVLKPETVEVPLGCCFDFARLELSA